MPAAPAGPRRPAALGRRELVAVVLAGIVLGAAMHWPVPAKLGQDVPGDLVDPLLLAWQVAWSGHALAQQPLDFYQSNAFWPLSNSLAFTDVLVGYAPAGLIGNGVKAAMARYDLLFLLAYGLAFIGPYLLARELGLGRAGAAVAGAAFAYAPWRLDQDGHLHVISSGGIPLCLFLFLRGYRARRPGVVLAGWLVATWQLSLGFTLGLQLAYLLVAVGALAAVAWFRRRPVLGRPLVAVSVGGVALFLLAGFLLSRPYVQVLDEHPEARRTLPSINVFSPPLRSYLAASPHNLVWGDATEKIRGQLTFPLEQTLFPGLATLTLAALGAFSAAYPRRVRIGLLLAAALCAWLALGIRRVGFRLPLEPYRLLYDYAPGWDAVRTPGRITTLTSLALALLAGAGAHRLVSAIRRRSGRRGHLTAICAGGALVAAILIEGSGFSIGERGKGTIAGPPHRTVPTAPPGQRGAPAPQLHLPLRVRDMPRYLIWSTDGFPAIVNGRGAFIPRELSRLERQVRRFPDPASVGRLRRMGVGTVILHPDLAAGTRWAAVARRPVRGLPLERERRDGVVLFRLRPPAPAGKGPARPRSRS